MPSRLKRLPSPADTEAVRLAKLTEAIVGSVPDDVRPQVTPQSGDSSATAANKWQRAVTESLADVQARVAAGIGGGTNVGAGQQYIHHQDVPADVWHISHELDGYPAVAVVDSSGRVGYGDVRYLDVNNLTVSFSAGFSGKAYLVL